jgi:hypothetical protein
MDQPKSETATGHDSPSGGSDCDDRKDSSPPSSGPSPKWALTSKPALLVLLALAGWGAWSLGYQLLLLSDTTLLFWVFIACVGLVLTHGYWRPRFDRMVEPLLKSKEKESQGTKWDWKTIVTAGIAIMVFKAVQESREPNRRFVPPPRGSAVYPQLRGQVPDPGSVDFAIQRNQKRQATATYWQTAVANLHAIRFEPPAGQEPAEQYYERMFQQLRSLTNAARSAPTTNVDADLVQMAVRHLAVEEQCLELKVKMDKLMQQERLPSLKDSVDQRMELSQVILNLLATNPEAVEALPAGPEHDLVEKSLELEQTRQEQYREIEIMQATLQERYKGTAFLLPTISQP